MHISWKRKLVLIAMFLGGGVLTACGTLSHNVAVDGSGAEQLVWPSPDSATPMHEGGTFPVTSKLRLVQPGMTQSQIMRLIGEPHFSEGVWDVREWDYLFNFRGENSGKTTQCEYKILFDEHKLARSFYWHPKSCARRLDTKPVPVSTTREKTFTILSDELFAFDKSAPADIKPGGMEQLEVLAKKIEAAGDDIRRIEVVGYTDRLGSEAYNLDLSRQRASTVMDVLKQKGVSADHIRAQGRGEADPLKRCSDQARAALIACLAPNRRVEVSVEGGSVRTGQ